MKGVKSWLMSLSVAALGIVIAGVILLGNDDSPQGEAFNPPTPAPLITTPVPTVTPVPLLGTLLPDAQPLSLEGESISLRETGGKAVILNFWATWCIPCRTEMPTLQNFAAQNSDSVQVVAVTDPDDGQTMAAIEDFVEEFEVADVTIALDEGGALRDHFLAETLPITYIIDSAGVVRFRHVGEVTEIDLADYLNRLQALTHEHNPE